jgi:hypothetical protein
MPTDTKTLRELTRADKNNITSDPLNLIVIDDDYHVLAIDDAAPTGAPNAAVFVEKTSTGANIYVDGGSAWVKAESAIKSVSAKTADYTVTVGESGSIFTNTGASGAVTFALPAAVAGLQYVFALGAAQELRVDPNGTETISLANGVQQAAGKYVVADAVGESAIIACVIAGQWLMLNAVGTWTAEA